MTLQAEFAATLVDEWQRCGLREAVVCPGSRSTPLVLALERHPGFRVHVRLDERSAAFFALGISLATGSPAVLVTTSGTAAVEVHAAVVEAHHAHVPLLVCTADRPPELRDTGSSQTIDQRAIFGSALRWSVDPGVAAGEARDSWRSLAGRIVAAAVRHPAGAGPVHVNLPFREPLVDDEPAAPTGRAGDAPWQEFARVAGSPAPEDLRALEVMLDPSRRGVIVAGEGSGPLGAVYELGDHLGWPVLADPRAAPRVPSRVLVAAGDALVRSGRSASSLRPDVVLRLGAPPSSRVLTRWLAESAPGCHVLVDGRWPWQDPDSVASHVVLAPPSEVVPLLAERSCGAVAHPWWLDAWRRAEDVAQGAIDDVLRRQPTPTEPAVARTVYGAVPPGSTLFASSSMPVRDLEWFARPRPGPPVVLANRGANGIDGVTSTALGVAVASPGAQVTALVGDLAFLHDLSGLVWGDERPPPATVVVVDNDGGGIFSFLPQARALPAATFERLFGTPQQADPAAFAGAAGLDTIVAGSLDELAEVLSHEPEGLRVVVVRTDRAENVAVHDRLATAVAAAVDAVLAPPE